MNSTPRTPDALTDEARTSFELGGQRVVYSDERSSRVLPTSTPDKAGHYGIPGLCKGMRRIALEMGLDKTRIEEIGSL